MTAWVEECKETIAPTSEVRTRKNFLRFIQVITFSLDRPYPDTPWNQGNNNSNSNDGPWRNNNRGNFGNNSNGGGGGGNFNSNFGGGGGGGGGSGGGNNMFSDNNFSSGLLNARRSVIRFLFVSPSDFERNWNSGGNSFNSFSGGGGGGGGGGNNSNSNSNSKNNLSSFDRDFVGGFNNFSNNSNGSGGGGNFSNDRFMNNGGGMNNSGGCNQYAVHLRGMPYDCGEIEVQQFFAPLKAVNVQVLYNNNGELLDCFEVIRC